MKKLKIKKRMTGFLMLAVMVVTIIGVIPKNIVHAEIDKDNFDGNSLNAVSTVKDDYTDGGGTHVNVQFVVTSSDNVYLVCADNGYYLVSKESFSVEHIETKDDGTTYARTKTETARADSCKHYDFYSMFLSISNKKMTRTCYVISHDTMSKAVKSNPQKYDSIPNHFLGAFLYDVSIMEFFEEHKEGEPDGTADNPYEDKEIGHLILTGQKGQDVLPENRDTDAVSSYQVFKWKSKTDTGFSLTKNKYAQTRIEAKVESRCVIYKHMNSYYVKNNFTSKKIEEDNEVKEKFKNFGESASISKVIPADSLEYVLSFDKIDELLPKTAKEWHNDLYVGHNYRVYFRVLCTDSLTVIPDENDNSWHSGGWSYVDFSLDGVVSGNGDGHFDENGEWVTDDKKDDINNGGRDTFVDDDAAKDDRNNSSDWGRKDTNSDSGLDTSSIKGFMNQVGNVPKAIGKLFTFLPDWVTTFIAFGFVLLIALMIIKAIRG